MKRIIPLNEVQIAMVEDNVSVINSVIFSRIIFDNNTYGLEYDDLFQEGALLLCKAALYYDESKKTSFNGFAYVVIRNGLMSYCKQMSKKKKDKLSYIEKAKKQYSGTAKRGIEALILKVKGFTGAEIAEKYNVKPNLVGAWISRAMKKLRNNSVFNLYMEDFFDKKAS